MGKLFVVGTPIGNLSDFSPRAKETLANVDFIAAEDTRVTIKLLNRFEIKTPLVSYHEHNQTTRGNEILTRLQNGENCALVTDAGMPAISDPGEAIVKLCRENNIKVESVPGPTAFATALAISGMSAGRFTFEGFLTMNKKGRKEHLESLISETRTMIFYEAPHKLLSTLKDLFNTFGERDIALCRELTKLHEQVINTTLSEALQYYNQSKPVGEFVLIITGAATIVQEEYSLTDAVKIAKDFIEEGMSSSFAAKKAATITGIKKGDIYKEIV